MLIFLKFLTSNIWNVKLFTGQTFNKFIFLKVKHLKVNIFEGQTCETLIFLKVKYLERWYLWNGKNKRKNIRHRMDSLR